MDMAEAPKRLGKLTFHMGADYACIMGERQTTDNPIIKLYGQSRDVEAYGKFIVETINAANAPRPADEDAKKLEDAIRNSGDKVTTVTYIGGGQYRVTGPTSSEDIDHSELVRRTVKLWAENETVESEAENDWTR